MSSFRSYLLRRHDSYCSTITTLTGERTAFSFYAGVLPLVVTNLPTKLTKHTLWSRWWDDIFHKPLWPTISPWPITQSTFSTGGNFLNRYHQMTHWAETNYSYIDRGLSLEIFGNLFSSINKEINYYLLSLRLKIWFWKISIYPTKIMIMQIFFPSKSLVP